MYEKEFLLNSIAMWFIFQFQIKSHLSKEEKRDGTNTRKSNRS